MFEIIDSVLGPLFRINPLRYAFDLAYRKAMTARLGKEAKYVFRYQVTFAVVLLAVLLALWAAK